MRQVGELGDGDDRRLRRTYPGVVDLGRAAAIGRGRDEDRRRGRKRRGLTSEEHTRAIELEPLLREGRGECGYPILALSDPRQMEHERDREQQRNREHHPSPRTGMRA